MCGINLIFGDQTTTIMNMNEAISHRGIRNTIHYENGVYLGHVRLPIQGIDRSHDHPLSIKFVTGAFVGEIFNYKEFYPDSKSDLPMLIKHFIMNAEKINPTIIDGFWSAIFLSRDKVHVITDDLSKKPLYAYCSHSRVKGISSEIRALKKLGGTTLDEVYFGAVAKWGYCPEDRTPFKEIIKLKPASHYIFNTRGVLEKVLHLIPITPVRRNIRDELESSVKNRLISDVPISLLLSGGLDSTIIFELVKKHTKDFTVFHVDNEEAEYLNYLDFKGIKVKELSLESVPLEEALDANESPVDLGSMMPQLALSKAIKKEGLNVALSGDGADELFGGYGRIKYYDSQASDIFHELIYYHLPRLDKLMMANTIELRCPFLARRVIEAALALPYEQRIRKKILKDLFSDIVPEPILNRKKRALKIKDLIEDPFKYRLMLIKKFKEVN